MRQDPLFLIQLAQFGRVVMHTLGKLFKGSDIVPKFMGAVSTSPATRRLSPKHASALTRLIAQTAGTEVQSGTQTLHFVGWTCR